MLGEKQGQGRNDSGRNDEKEIGGK